MKKSGIIYCLALLIVFVYYYICFLNLVKQDSRKLKKASPDNNEEKKTKEKGKKIILLYTTLFNENQWSDISEKKGNQLIKDKCDVKNCVITYNRLKYSEASAVVFHGKDFKSIEMINPIIRRKPQQLWAWFSSESPQSAPFIPFTMIPFEKCDTMFNLTISYKHASHIQIPYAKYNKYKAGDKIPVLKQNYAQGKSKMIAWMISNCEPYARRRVADVLLNRGIQIDITGICVQYFTNYGRMNCSRDCSQILPQYKFFYAAENVVCTDYVTEKYWTYPMKFDMIPIVLKADDKTMIPGSYISIDQFHTAEELATHLKLLDQHDELYNKYFEWRKTYYVIKNNSFPYASVFLCELCKTIQTEPLEQKITKMSVEWNKTLDCDSNDQNSKYLLDTYRKVTTKRIIEF